VPHSPFNIEAFHLVTNEKQLRSLTYTGLPKPFKGYNHHYYQVSNSFSDNIVMMMITLQIAKNNNAQVFVR